MNRVLIIGATGLIGSALVNTALSSSLTFEVTRRAPGASHHLDLLESDAWTDLAYDLVFIAAGVSGFRECEGNREAWRVNADGVARFGAAHLRAGAFVVYVSSPAVEWSDSAYARARAYAECALIGAGDQLAIIRPEKITTDNAAEFAAWLLDIGLERRAGVRRWPLDGKPSAR